MARELLDRGFSRSAFNVASGAKEAVDALSAGALSGKQNRGLLLTDTATSGQPVMAFAHVQQPTLNTVGQVFGSSAAVSTQLQREIERAGVQGLG